jgi:hypothetical protein
VGLPDGLVTRAFATAPNSAEEPLS